ncbi:MAG: tetratricopeptide repeat protein [Myxococcales bacterium]|nr:MAG: tetratricopeptide repeat protein [Myxococcales bacterium]
MLGARLRLLLALGLFAGLTSLVPPVAAQVPVGAAAGDREETETARTHFDRSLELYRAGRYTEALAQLKRAAELDPGGKDLFFNLSLVHEKLGQLPAAIAALERFRELETDPKERERARIIIERLRGAEQAGVTAPSGPAPCPPTPAPPVQATGPKPLLSPVQIGAASIAVVSVVTFAVFGLKALADDVSDERTSASLSVEQLRARGRRAEREALVADVALALGVASSATFVSLWLLTPPEPSASRGAGITLRGYF